MASDPRKLFDQRDAMIAAIYGKRNQTDEEAYACLVDASGYLLVNMTVGTISLSSTASVITNAVGNPVNVALTSTEVTVAGSVSLTSSKVTIESSSGVNVNVASATLGTVTVSGTVTPSTTASTITNAVGNPVNVALTSTVVTVKSAVAGFNVNVATATLGTVTVTGTVTPSTTAGTVPNSVSTIILISKTLTGSTGSVSTTWTSIATPTDRMKIYAFSFTTTSASEVTVLVCDGVFANAKEFWRATLMAPAGSNAGANLAISPPSFLFATRSASAVTISLSTAVLVHYSLSYFDEA